MEQNDIFEIEVDGRKVKAKSGQSIAEAMLASGFRVFRKTRNDAPRGFYCGMGVCYECRMIVNGLPNVRTCMTLATPGCKVTTQNETTMKVGG
jgi:predicted molibdopterin-dependent oxidoreductase YjgC